MKVLVIGQGGREHALCWKLAQSENVSAVFAAPGNPGTATIGENVAIAVDDCEGLAAFALKHKIDLTVVGPEYPLILGVVDLFRTKGLRVFGPSKAAAAIEGSKAVAKEVMDAAGVPTAAFAVFRDRAECEAYVTKRGAPIVLKADGLAAGKGVFVCVEREDIAPAIESLFGQMKVDQVLVEDYLDGVEASYIVATDGERVFPFDSSHDYKRIFEGDEGPNTGGMGTVSPTPRLSREQADWALTHVMNPVIAAMKERGTPFVGFLYAGLMLTPDGGIKVLEFNARLGDPEGQVLLRRMETDLFELLYALSGDRAEIPLPKGRWLDGAAVCVVLAAEGYPDRPKKGDPILGVESAEEIEGVQVFHAGTAVDSDGKLMTGGGRVLNVTATGGTIVEARRAAYNGVKCISFDGRQFRSDIAAP